MRKFIVLTVGIILFFGQQDVDCQGLAPDPGYFSSPVDYSITLAGSFAELRQTHFHAGIDIKPKSKNGIDTVRAAADGYISRIKVQTGGYGQALYMDHPNGYTTVYAHLKVYNDTIGKYIRYLQRKTQSYTLDIYTDSTSFYFKKGDVLGLMGNTGQSYAKHLHFEIRETESEIPVNPALFGLKPEDDRPPVVLSVDLHQISPDFYEHHSKSFYPTGKNDGTYTIGNGTITFPAWQCGISVQSYDLMNGAPNRNGVFYQKTFVDDTLIHSFTLDKVSFNETRFINSHVDYSERVNNNRTLVRSYVLPGNRLSVYDSIRNNGLIHLYKEKPRSVRIVLGDIEGNESIVQFKVKRAAEISPPMNVPYNFKISQGLRDTVQAWGATVIFSPGSLDRDLYLSMNKMDDGYRIGQRATKLFSPLEISLPIGDIPQEDYNFLGIWINEEDEWVNLGGRVQKGKITTYTSGMGEFKLGMDTIPPIIKITTPVSSMRPGKTVKGHLYDNMPSSGLAGEVSYNVMLDGEWLIAAYKIMTRELKFDIPENLAPGKHTLIVEASDHHGNKSIKTIEFSVEQVNQDK